MHAASTTYLCFAGDNVLIEAEFLTQTGKLFVFHKRGPQHLYKIYSTNILKNSSQLVERRNKT